MKKFIATFLLAGGVIFPTIAYFQQNTTFLWIGIVCDLLLFVLLVD